MLAHKLARPMRALLDALAQAASEAPGQRRRPTGRRKTAPRYTFAPAESSPRVAGAWFDRAKFRSGTLDLHAISRTNLTDRRADRHRRRHIAARAMGPEALRVAGLAEALRARGIDVVDRGNLDGSAQSVAAADRRLPASA